MRLATFELNGQQDWGLVNLELGLICPSKLWLGEGAPKTLLDFIRLYHDRTSSLVEPKPSRGWLKLEEVHILAPIPRPTRNVFCVGKNYQDHVSELARVGHSTQTEILHPHFFTKATNAVTGPYSKVYLHPQVTSQVDYEAELAVIIGKGGINIPEERAIEHVFGYTILNDLTARDLQKNHVQWFKGKSLDGFCPMGPWIVTKDEITHPVELRIRTWVNGELRQDSNTKYMIFSVAKLISILSQGLTLEPGDILATGTPSGVGMGFSPPKLLKAGDVVRIEIEKIGHIENQMYV
ncbi:MAG: fumarylacetoacetate hydrolase family protein [Pseudothermotoga sp.]|nr:fumarylacetoacetate hydrolase family protein [Pseudothermotoga sp.]